MGAVAAIAVAWGLAVLAAEPGGAAKGQPRWMIATYDAELRRADGRVDCQLMVRRLAQLGVNAYFWLIWHAPTDWEDLKEFLPLAERAGIDVWVYLVPPSEPPPSQPFGLDFVRWAREIALLSREHENLRGFVIDDFYANRAKLTPEYIRRMVAAGREVNARLKFYPLMYFWEIGPEFMRAYAPVIDGVVVAYPRDREIIRQAARILRDEVAWPARCEMRFPWNRRSAAGDMAEIACTVRPAEGAERQIVRFRWRDDFAGPTAGYHFAELVVGGEVVWKADVAGGDGRWRQVQVDVTKQVAGKRSVELALGCRDEKAVSNFGVRVEFSGLELDGFAGRAPNLGRREDWKVEVRGAWNVSFEPAWAGTGQYKLPFIVMPAGSPSQFRKRHPGSEGTPGEVARHIRMILEAMRAGECDGIAIYCLPLREGNEYFRAVQALIEAIGGR